MKKLIVIAIVCCAVMCAIMASPVLARNAVTYLSEPVTMCAAKLTGLTACPLALLLPLLFIKSPKKLAAVMLIMYSVTWYPCHATAVKQNYQATNDEIRILCNSIIDSINSSETERISVGNAIEQSRYVAGTPVSPKEAPFPRLMRGLKIAGMYSPITAEAIIDATRSGVSVPFTAVHELTHMLGAYDEAETNYRAYIACIDYGGAFAYSAKLWILKYALTRVNVSIDSLNPASRRDLQMIPATSGEYANVVDIIIRNNRSTTV